MRQPATQQPTTGVLITESESTGSLCICSNAPLTLQFLSEICNQNLLCVIAVSKSQEFLLKVRRLSLFFFDDGAIVGIRLRRRVDVFSTTSDTI